MIEKQTILLKDKQVPLSVRRHRRAKRISIRITPTGEGVVLTLPMRTSLEKAMAFLHQKADWVVTHITPSQHFALQEGAEIPLLGSMVTIRHAPGRGVTRLEGDALRVHGAPEFTARRVKDFLKKHMQAYCHAQAVLAAQKLERTVKSVRVAELRARWGSCTAKGALAFNWRLVFAPRHVTDYLIAHEVAHLREMNHSARFWKCVALLYPDYKQVQAWLKREGNSLYYYN